MGKNKILL